MHSRGKTNGPGQGTEQTGVNESSASAQLKLPCQARSLSTSKSRMVIHVISCGTTLFYPARCFHLVCVQSSNVVYVVSHPFLIPPILYLVTFRMISCICSV